MVCLLSGCEYESDIVLEDKGWKEITGTYNMFYNETTREVMQTTKGSNIDSVSAANLHYKNYVLYYCPDYNIFYYYNNEDEVIKIDREEILSRPDFEIMDIGVS